MSRFTSLILGTMQASVTTSQNTSSKSLMIKEEGIGYDIGYGLKSNDRQLTKCKGGNGGDNDEKFYDCFEHKEEEEAYAQNPPAYNPQYIPPATAPQEDAPSPHPPATAPREDAPSPPHIAIAQDHDPAQNTPNRKQKNGFFARFRGGKEKKKAIADAKRQPEEHARFESAEGLDPSDKSTKIIEILQVREIMKLFKFAPRATIDTKNKSGFPVLHVIILSPDSSQSEKVEMVKVILEKNSRRRWPLSSIIDVESNLGYTALHSAVLKENIELVRLLVKNGANIDVVSNLGYTPLHYAVIRENSKLVQLLVELDANVSIKDNDGKTALELAKDSTLSSKGRDEIIRILEAKLEH